MLTVPHVVLGAALGQAVSEVPGAGLIAFGLGWASHYLLDSLPHWERLFGSRGPDFSTETPVKEWPRLYLIQAVIDVVLSALVIGYLIWRVPHGDNFLQNPVFWGAAGALFPDLLDNVPFWNRRLTNLPFFKQQRFLHQYFHISETSQLHLPKFAGLATQLIVFVFSMWLLLSS